MAATTGSSRCQPVSATSRTPTRTPTDVHTSVIRCLPSAARVAERWVRPARINARPTAPFTAVATVEIANPAPRRSSATGWMKRWTALARITAAATKIMRPSRPAEKYSALPWPYWWWASGGRAATLSAISAMTAATRLTTDSAASESNPTEPVTRYAAVFRVIVVNAAPMDSQA